MALNSDLVTQFRILINDNDVTQSWTDTQLSQFLCIGASQLNAYLLGLEISFVISFSDLLITPDPHDTALTNPIVEQLLLLKSAENLNDAEIKKLYASSGYKISDDKSTIDTTSMSKSLESRGKMYKGRFETLLMWYLRNSRGDGCAVATPFLNAGY